MLKKLFSGKWKRPLTNDEIKWYFKRMELFTFDFQQEVHSFMRLLKVKRIPLTFALEAIERRQDMLDEEEKNWWKDRKRFKAKGKRCPKCGQIMALQPIYEEPGGKANLKGYKAIWLCTRGWQQEDPKKWCGHHAYTTVSMNKILKKMGIKAKVPTRQQVMAGCRGKKRGKQND